MSLETKEDPQQVSFTFFESSVAEQPARNLGLSGRIRGSPVDSI